MNWGRSSILLLVITLALAMVLGACQTVEPAPPVPTPADDVESATTDADAAEVASIFETPWTVKNFGGADTPLPSIDGTNPSINFMGVRYEGFTGCNYFVGTYRVDTENQVRLDPPAVTKAICEDDALQTQQEAFLTILITAEEFAFEGDNIVLFGGGKQLMTLEPLPEAPLEGTTWNYRFFQGEQALWQPAIPGTTVTAMFEGDTISGSAGCNDYSGTFTITENEITISDLASTMMMCSEPEDIMAQEERYLAGLANATHIQKSARSIQLFADEQPIMLFSAD